MTIKLAKYFAVILVFIIIPYFLDQVDGFVNLVLMESIPISKIYKTPTLLYAIAYVFMFDKTRKYSLILLGYLLLFVCSTLVNMNDQQSDIGTIATDLGYLLRIFTFPVLFFYFSVFHRYNPFPDIWFVKKVFLFLYFAFVTAIILSYFGFGIPFYGTTEGGESIGQQGYFAAGNEISGMLILLNSAFFFFIFRNKSIVYMFISLGLSIITGLLMGSKTAMLSSVICFLVVYFLMKFYDRKSLVVTKLDASLIITFTGVILLAIIFVNVITDIIQPVIGHLVYRYRVSGDVVKFLTSGRLVRAEGILNNYSNNFSLLHMLFGIGYSFSRDFNMPNTRYATAEMDLPDILNVAGLIGVTLIYYFWLNVFTKLCIAFKFRKNEMAVPIVVAMGILIINSNISGHIIYSNIVNPSLAYLAVYALKYSRWHAEPEPEPEEIISEPISRV